MINRLLVACLHRNKRLVIPTLGAFIRKKIDNVGEVLVFVPFLNKDDGVLQSAIKSWAGVEDEEASEILSQYIEAIKSSLDTRGQYFIESIGALKYDTNGIVYLAKESEIEKEKREIEAKKAEEVVEEPKVEEPVEEPTPISVPVPEPVKPVEEVVPVAAQPVVESEKVVVQVVVAPQQAPIAEKAPEPPTVSQVVPEQQNDDYLKRYQQPATEHQGGRSVADIYGQGGYNPARQVPNQVGTRYFTPTRNEEISTIQDNFEQEVEQTPQRYNEQPTSNGSSQRGDVNSVYNRRRKNGGNSRVSDIYSSQNSAQQSLNSEDGVRKGSQQSVGKRKIQKPKKKKNDIVLWIAIIAILLTIGVLIYGFNYSGEQTLESMDVYQEVVTPVSPELDTTDQVIE